MNQLVLSLFPGIDLLGRAFREVGFCVVQGGDPIFGGDIRQECFTPGRGRFNGVIGGPPCQEFSSLAHMVRHNGHQPKFGNLIPEFERAVYELAPSWFLMENVRQAPEPKVPGYGVHSFIINNRQCLDEDGRPAVQHRTRRISFGLRGDRRPLLVDVGLWESPVFEYAACGGTHGSLSRELNGDSEAAMRARARKRGVPIAIGGSGKPKPAARGRQRETSCVGFNFKTKSSLSRLCELQGLPPDFMQHSAFTVEAACKAIGNGVPMPMGRALARAVKEATA